MKKKVTIHSLLLTSFLLLTSSAFADCLILPVIGNGKDGNEFRPAIPAAVQSLPGMKWTAFIPPKATTAIVCFPDSLKLPVVPGVQKMTRDDAAREISQRDLKIPFKPDAINLPADKTSFQKFLDRAIRSANRYLGPTLAWATTSTDAFPYSNGALETVSSGAWSVYDAQSCNVLSNTVVTANSVNRCIEGYETLVPGNNQYAQAVLSNLDLFTAGDLMVVIRLAAPTTYSGYFCRVSPDGGGTNTEWYIQRRDAGSATNLTSPDISSAFATADVLRCEANGTTITLKKNGATLTSAVDATYASGRGGIALRDTNSPSHSMNTFEVGDLAGGVARVPRKPIVIQ